VSLPLGFIKAADLLPVVVFGYDSKGKPKSPLERAEAARDLISAVETLQKDVGWVITLANKVITKAGGAAVKLGTKLSASRAIAKVRSSAAGKFGAEAAEELMQRVTPALEAVGEWFGEAAAWSKADGVVSAVEELAAKSSAAAGRQLVVEKAIASLSTRLVFLFEVAEFAGSPPVMAAIEILRFEFVELPKLYAVALKSFDAWLSTGVFGMPVAQLKEQVRSQSMGSMEDAAASIKYFFEKMFANAQSATRLGWPDARRKGFLDARNPYWDKLSSADALIDATYRNGWGLDYRVAAAKLLQQVALGYIDEEFRRNFQGREPPP
jgi:hypothetical protein